jgi:hypothetical protein
MARSERASFMKPTARKTLFWIVLTAALLGDGGLVVFFVSRVQPRHLNDDLVDNQAKDKAKRSLSLIIADAKSEQPIAHARITVNFIGDHQSVNTAMVEVDQQGRCSLPMPSRAFRKMLMCAYAPGYTPTNFGWSSATMPVDHRIFLKPVPEPAHLWVRLPNGQPAQGVRVVPWRQDINVDLGALDSGRVFLIPDRFVPRRIMWRVEPDPESEHGAESETAGTEQYFTDNEGGFVYHPDLVQRIALFDPSGYAYCSIDELERNSNVINLTPWSRIEGTLRIGEAPGAGRSVSAQNYSLLEPQSIAYWITTITDTNGHFVFDRLPAGQCEVARFFPSDHTVGPVAGLSHCARIELLPAQTTQVVIGGVGRTVCGQLEAQDVRPGFDWASDIRGWLDTGNGAKLTAVPPSQAAVIRRLGAGIQSDHVVPTPDAHQSPRFYLECETSGHFMVEDVPPGHYTLVLEGAEPWASHQPDTTANATDDPPAQTRLRVGRNPNFRTESSGFRFTKEVVIPPGGQSQKTEVMNLGTVQLSHPTAQP